MFRRLRAGTWNAIIQSTQFTTAAIAQNFINAGAAIGNVSTRDARRWRAF